MKFYQTPKKSLEYGLYIAESERYVRNTSTEPANVLASVVKEA